MVLRPTISAPDLRATFKVLDALGDDIRKQFPKDMKSAVLPVAKTVQASLPTTPPLSGMNHQGRTAWRPVSASVSVTPGRPRRGTVSPLVSIKLGGRGLAGLKIAEFAGMRGKFRDGQRSKSDPSYLINGQGRALVAALAARYPVKGKGGRFAYDRFLKESAQVLTIAKGVIDKYVDMANRRLAK
jgi:hypothetical protein